MNNIILASKSRVRNDILITNGIICEVIPSNVDEDSIKESLTKKPVFPFSSRRFSRKPSQRGVDFPGEFLAF